MSALRSHLRDLSPGVADRLRRLSRLRWVTKTRLMREYGVPLGADPKRTLAYVLLDPEVGDFSYDLLNEAEVADGLAAALGAPSDRVRALFVEARSRPALTTGLAERARRRPDMKARIPLGPRIAWYATVRLLRPRLVVETGIKHGIGSAVLLEALARNAEEDGVEGRLVSADLDPASGWIVPEHLRGRWDRLVGKADEAVPAALRGEPVDLLIHDTPPLPEVERAEYELALAHGAPRVVLMSGSNGDQTGVLPAVAAAHDAAYHLIRERPDHWYPGTGIGLATIERAPAG